MNEQYHIPVMLPETIDMLDIVKDGLYIDCTLGGGGHTLEIIKKGGRVIGIDRDPAAVKHSKEILSSYHDRFEVHTAVFSDIEKIAGVYAGSVDGVLMDLGMSSRMIDDQSRGFSYRGDGPLLMNMGESSLTASYIINNYPAEELTLIFRKYGEERFASKIAAAIVKARTSGPLNTTKELSEIIEKTVGGRMPQKSKARVFQALRIYVNDELNELEKGLAGAVKVLKPGGRLCVISYHSIEDRIVKNFMVESQNPCICPKGLPECRCGKEPLIKIITRKPVTPSEMELAANVRSHSARLRAAEKLAGVVKNAV